MEEWRDVVGYEGEYQVSNNGKVRSLNYGNTGCVRVIKEKRIRNRKNGHLYVSLWKNRKEKTFLVHRLVAEAFIPNPLGLPIVNHKDENAGNNNASNLEWCNYTYNKLYSIRRKRGDGIEDLSPSMGRIHDKRQRKHHFGVAQIGTDGSVVAKYKNANVASLRTGYHNYPILECCKGNRKKAYGYKWEFC